MTAEPSCEAATYTEQIQKFRIGGKVLCGCKSGSSIIWISLPGGKKTNKERRKNTREDST